MASAISIKDLTVTFSGCEAIQSINFELTEGKVLALLGENGAGKTTLIRTLTGFQQPTHGSCLVLGHNPETEADEVRRKIGYVSDAPALYDWMRVEEIGWFAASFYQANYFDCYRDLIGQFEVPANRKIKHLSKGQRAKVALSLALAHDPALLILDEPTSGLDPLVRREFLESMLDRVATGRTVFLSSHQIAEVERVADEVAIMHQGQLQVVGDLQELRESICELTISLDDPLTSLPEFVTPANIMYERSEGRQIRMIVKNFDSSMCETLESLPGVLNVRMHNASLEEIFMACTRGTVRKSVGLSSRTRSSGVA